MASLHGGDSVSVFYAEAEERQDEVVVRLGKPLMTDPVVGLSTS